MKMLISHISDTGNRKEELLEDHLRLTSEYASKFGKQFDMEYTAGLLGRIHDFGKASVEFQDYIRNRCDSDEDVSADTTNSHSRKGPDHSTAAAQWLSKELHGGLGELLGYVVAGHHSGIPDGRSDSCGSAEYRIRHKRICAWFDTASNTLPRDNFNVDFTAIMHELVNMRLRDPMSLSGRLRMLFSALTDADFLATERFMDGDRATVRACTESRMHELNQKLAEYLKTFDNVCRKSEINDIRIEIRNACLAAADEDPGLFTLEVPTGGGKTLSSMAFAVRHAVKYKLERIIYVIPYTSIIEQNAAVFKRIFGDDSVIEHHSNRDPEATSYRAKLLMENWDAPIVVTTNVQFFESLYSNRTSRCRKLHNMAKSVIVMDEAQSLPASFLRPCLHALDELVNNCGSTVMICTATMPSFFAGDMSAIGKSSTAWNGLAGNEFGRRDIAADLGLEKKLSRVKTERIMQPLSDADLAEKIKDEHSALVIVSTRSHARNLYKTIKQRIGEFGVYHLSALMCPNHRLEVLNLIRSRLNNGERCILISTQLVEAGVDLDFPCVYREIAGCDSMVQAAGRCNREGKLKCGRVVIFESTEKNAIPSGYLSGSAAKGKEVISLPEFSNDVLSLQAVKRYFKLEYNDLDAVGALDAKEISKKFTFDGSDSFGLQFRECAESFKLIADTGITVYIPYGKQGRELCEKLRNTYAIGEIREIIRRLNRYSVTVYGTEPRDVNGNLYAEKIHDLVWVVTSPEQNYSGEYGLTTEDNNQIMLI